MRAPLTTCIVNGVDNDNCCLQICKAPVIDLLMEDTEERQFHANCDGHVILDCVQRSQHKVEDTDRISQFWRQALYDNSKAADSTV